MRGRGRQEEGQGRQEGHLRRVSSLLRLGDRAGCLDSRALADPTNLGRPVLSFASPAMAPSFLISPAAMTPSRRSPDPTLDPHRGDLQAKEEPTPGLEPGTPSLRGAPWRPNSAWFSEIHPS